MRLKANRRTIAQIKTLISEKRTPKTKGLIMSEQKIPTKLTLLNKVQSPVKLSVIKWIKPLLYLLSVVFVIQIWQNDSPFDQTTCSHDENNECGVGDTVRIKSTRPLSKPNLGVK